MITARQARNISKCYARRKQLVEIEEIEEMILDSANGGNYSISVSGRYISEQAVEYFQKKRGFTVETCGDTDNYYYKISWMPKKKEGNTHGKS